MSELEKIFENSCKKYAHGAVVIDYKQFKSALTEVFDKVRVTDEEWDKIYKEAKSHVAKKHGVGTNLVTGHRASYFEEAAKWSRDLQQQKLEKLLNP